MANYWVFGASKPLGAGLTKALRVAHDVTCFGRSLPPGEIENRSFVRIDFSDVTRTRQVVGEQIAAAAPDGAVFCQRYRPQSGQSDLDAVKAGLDVELAPVLAVLDGMKALKQHKPLSLVLISSVAGLAAHVDIPLYYHLLKAVTVSAAKTLAAHGAADSVRVNCVILGEFEKYPRAGYAEKEKAKFDALETFALSRRLCTVPDIADVAAFLLSEQSRYVTGQMLHLDGGLSGLAPESVVRTLLAKPGA
jgi:NAD(P)-dependent dehydrogenase (short-subunit alcohol dehydrogenase family)